MAQAIRVSIVVVTTVDFEDSKRAINVEKLVRLWLLSGLSGQEFMELMQADVMRKKGRGRR